MLAAGETSGTDRLPFLQKGIAARLARATHGVAVVLEHRYYGTSFPYGNLSTTSLRFLRMEQAMADTAYFAQHVQFLGLEDVDLSPRSNAKADTKAGAPWIIYGGSYAGAFAAFCRILYPDVFWGAISSSGVTKASYDYWQYYEAQRLYGPPKCVGLTQKLIHVADQILLAGREGQRGEAPLGVVGQPAADQQPLGASSRSRRPSADSDAATRVAQLKTVFGMGGITHDDDFASVLSDAMGNWQLTNWDPAENDPKFGWYCANITADALLYPALEERRASVRSLLAATTYRNAVDTLEGPMLNFIGWVQQTHTCNTDSRTHDQCFSNRNATFYQQDDSTQLWRAWAYQYCTQWGYLSTGSGVPADQLPLISRLLDLDYLSIVCREAFGVTQLPDMESVNKFGGFDIRYPRLALVDGEADPWRAATPHVLGDGPTNPDRPSTTDEPFLLIGGGAVHHWDEYGLLDNETTAELPPSAIRSIHAAEEDFVTQWVADWARQQN